MRTRWLSAAVGILAEACVAHASRLPPPAAAPESQAPAAIKEHCGLVQRAARTFVGLGEGLTLDDMAAAAQAARAVVHALDDALCVLLARTVPNASTDTPLQYQPLTTAIEVGAHLEVTQIMLAGASISTASAELHVSADAAQLDTWQAKLEFHESQWQLISFEPASRP